LYCQREGIWKIADFGFSREGASKTTIDTSGARGTESYRAPELVKFPGATFSDRSDIWAAGCILHELASRQKAFRSDWHVGEYERSQIKLLIPLQAFVEADTLVPLMNLIHEMLQIKPKSRPSARELCALFEVLMRRKWYTFLVESDIPLLSKISKSVEEEETAILMYI
jgi:serine/threonine protein kinase